MNILKKIYRKILFLSSQPNRYLKLIPKISIDEVIKVRHFIQVDGGYTRADGSPPWSDIITLLTILVDRNPASVLEIGTFNGDTTRLIARNLPQATVHTIDLPQNFIPGSDLLPKDDFHLINSRKVGIEYISDNTIKNVVQHFADTASWDFSKADASFFFIDGSHTYEYVRNDTQKALDASVGKAITILWHDCDSGHHGVTRWLAEMVSMGHPVKHIQGTNLAIMDTTPFI